MIWMNKIVRVLYIHVTWHMLASLLIVNLYDLILNTQIKPCSNLGHVAYKMNLCSLLWSISKWLRSTTFIHENWNYSNFKRWWINSFKSFQHEFDCKSRNIQKLLSDYNHLLRYIFNWLIIGSDKNKCHLECVGILNPQIASREKRGHMCLF